MHPGEAFLYSVHVSGRGMLGDAGLHNLSIYEGDLFPRAHTVVAAKQ